MVFWVHNLSAVSMACSIPQSTALHYAANLDVVKCLVEKKANVNSKDCDKVSDPRAYSHSVVNHQLC